ncbi:NAD dependent epimerase/dehydratase family protein [Pleurostoma richardsiae]|uniref:NAD dependent epimerase/dehydratase family protein n=1 Tax=Pleurostoma richardsiae TaxID=41990 RepID=A0AA38RAG4_9PEZI|nr:NAD dependent epimerase/dehydratase family protein [Pleurostoma richardsiae]
MRVFVTGATGFIGQAVVKELLSHGHQVLGLSRSDAGAKSLTDLGADVQRGSLEDLDSLKQGAAAADGVIHLAFIHDFSDYAGSCRRDREAIEAMGTVLQGTGKPLVMTSGTLMLARGRLGKEDDPADLSTPSTAARGASEVTALALADKGVRVSVMRLPPTNHGDGDHGFVAMVVAAAREKGVSAYVGDGANRWPATHRLDTARAFRLALEKGAAGSVFHAVAEEGVPLKDVAEAVGKGLGLPVASIPAAEAQGHFGFLAFAVGEDNPTSSAKTREVLGWAPQELGLIADIEKGTYFKQ